MSQVRAKFLVHSVTETADGKQVRLFPVTSGSAENTSFYKWTPSGSIELGTVNPEAAKHFVPGRQFYVDFTDATPAAPAA